MADRIHVEPANLRESAIQHEQIAEYLRTIPSSHPAIQESLDSLGPVFGGLRDAGRELLEERRRCYQQQADDHADIAAKLRAAANLWERHEADAARSLGDVVDDER